MGVKHLKTVDETILQERCPVSKGLDADLRIIAKQSGPTKCEQLEKAMGQWVELKLQSECLQAQGSIKDDRCRYVNPRWEKTREFGISNDIIAILYALHESSASY
ncbi:MAG: hypothetical protein WBF33_21770 [Candidatus Nitrosopolaris sp.]|jgi:hypothetical protein